jgi:hypothetical protein
LLALPPFPGVADQRDEILIVAGRRAGQLCEPDWLAWLDLTQPEAELLRPLPAGNLTVEQVR